jgi:hemoglobin
MVSGTLFEKYGGFSTISKIVSVLYDRVLAQESLAPFFQDVNMQRLMQHQTQFIAMVMGAPANQYQGRELASAHRGMNIKSEHFDLVAQILGEVLLESGVEDNDIKTMLAAVAATRGDIVT